jgi:tetratricopeptide (TPR) repeat protein
LEGLLAIGDVHSAAYLLNNLADIHHLRLEHAQAMEKLGQASETLRIVNDMVGLASVESERTSCLLWAGQIREARSAIEQLLREAEGKGTERLWGYRLNQRAIVQLVQGETDAAIATLRQAHDLPSVGKHRMLHFELHSTLALALTVAGDSEAASHELADEPRFEGLSRWAELDRNLIEGYVALARGDARKACDFADQVLQHGGEYPLYRQSAQQLIAAIQQSAPARAFPRLLWVGRQR